MLTTIKRLIKKLSLHVGVDVRESRPERTSEARIVKICEQLGLNTILDVGANRGQFAESIFRAGFQKNIISFEPLHRPHLELKRRAMRWPGWVVASRCAIGSQRASSTIYRSKNEVSSSLLRVLPAHISVEPDTAAVGEEIVSVIPLNQVDGIYQVAKKGLFLKIDTQGFEVEVLKGADLVINHVGAVFIECSLVPLYRDSPTIKDVMEKISRLGFSVTDVFPGLYNLDGSLLQLDLLAVRNDWTHCTEKESNPSPPFGPNK
jgi:FkbM family methyltransferase